MNFYRVKLIFHVYLKRDVTNMVSFWQTMYTNYSRVHIFSCFQMTEYLPKIEKLKAFQQIFC